jgi:hypothetical protein
MDQGDRRALSYSFTGSRHVAPDGTVRKDGLKVVEGGKIRYGKKNDCRAPLTRFSVHLLLRPRIGGLGHMALQFANKWGCEVHAFTTSDSKEAEARKL